MGGVKRSPTKTRYGKPKDAGDVEKADGNFARVCKLTLSGASGISDPDTIKLFSCGKCHKQVRDQDEGVQCDCCEKWHHGGCVGIGGEYYRLLSESKIDWVCTPCKESITNMKRENTTLANENELLREENKLLKERLASLERRVTEIKDELKKEIIDEVNINVTQMIDSFKEVDDKKKRENNLVLYNMEESKQADGKNREKEDIRKCQQLIQEGIGIEQDFFNIKKAIRLGKWQNSQERPRPLLIRLDDAEEKWNIIKKAKNLKNYTHHTLKKVIVTLDLTPKEQERDRILRGELKEKIEKGETGWYIKGGKLLKQNQPKNYTRNAN